MWLNSQPAFDRVVFTYSSLAFMVHLYSPTPFTFKAVWVKAA